MEVGTPIQSQVQDVPPGFIPSLNQGVREEKHKGES